jgi:hypothetical protein
MPKRKGYLWDELATAEMAKVAMRMAARGKNDRPAVAVHLTDDNFEKDAEWLAALVREKRFKPKPTINVRIQDGPHKKPRDISIPVFWPDQCVHWMLMLCIQPIIMRGMYEYNCGSIPGRGTKFALDAVMRWLNDDPKNCVWCLQLDVAKFYEHIQEDALMKMFRRVIKDPNALWLIETIVRSREKGVPIGFYTSQWFANFYLQGIDHTIKERLKVKHYVRYMDDMMLFGPNKRELLKAKDVIEKSWKRIGMHIKSNESDPHKTTWAIFRPRDKKIVFLGSSIEAIRIADGKHRYKWMRTLSRENMLRMTRRIKRIYRKGTMTPTDACAVVSFYGAEREGNNWRFEQKWMRPYANMDRARRVISDAGKMQAAARTIRH